MSDFGEATEVGVVAAAMMCGVSEDSIRRRLKDGRLPGARRDANGVWQIPIAALREARFGSGRRDPHRGNPDVVAGPRASLRPGLGSEDRTVEAQAHHIADLQAEILRLHELLLAALDARNVNQPDSHHD